LHFDKFRTLLLFSLIPVVILNSTTPLFADHGGIVQDCGLVVIGGPYWDPNTMSCVAQCPAGLSLDGGLNADVTLGLIHCSLIQSPVGGELINLESTAILLAGTHSVAAWMIPVIVSAIGIGIVIARKL